MEFGRLMHCRNGQVVRLADCVSNQEWRVVRVRDRREMPLRASAYRARPELLRSQCYAVLQNVNTGRIRTVYHAENVGCHVL